MVEILCEQNELKTPDALAQADHLWLDRDTIEAVTGWSWKPEGLCRGEVCVPLPRRASASASRDSNVHQDLVRDGKLDIAAMWAYMGHPVVHDAASSTWVLGTGAEQRAQALATLDAPDFMLPDLAGQPHRLSDYRGKKVFLATWASW